MRKYVFGIPVIKDRELFVDAVVDRFLAGLGSGAMVAPSKAGKTRPLSLH